MCSVVDLQSKYGSELSDGPLSQCTSAYYLHKALTAKGIKVTIGVVKEWWKKHKVVTGPSITSAKDLQEQHGALVKDLAIEHDTAYKLCKVLRERDRPLFVTDSVARQWLLKYAGHEKLTSVHNSGYLETWYGLL